MRVNIENDWLVNNALFGSSNFVSKYVDAGPDILELEELFA